jgi:signal transduction histidine kinase
VNLGDFVTEIGAYHRDRLASSDISVKIAARAPAIVFVSPGRLAQVLDNLILNSEYWVLREIDKTDTPGYISLKVSGAKVRVADSGPGVPSEMLDAIFRPYVSMKSEGRGLGLFVARQLLEIDGGTLEVGESPDGRNSLFEIDLSAARKDDSK